MNAKVSRDVLNAMAGNAFSPLTCLHSASLQSPLFGNQPPDRVCAGLEQVLSRVMSRALQGVTNLAFHTLTCPAQHVASTSANQLLLHILATKDRSRAHLVCSDTAHYSHQLRCMLGAHKLPTLQLSRDVRSNHVVTAMQMVDEGASMGSIWWVALQWSIEPSG